MNIIHFDDHTSQEDEKSDYTREEISGQNWCSIKCCLKVNQEFSIQAKGSNRDERNQKNG